MCAHHADVTFVRGGAPGPPPDLADWERPLFDQVSRQLLATLPARVRIDRELADGDELTFGGGAITVAVPGNTPGSVAIYLPGRRVLFTGGAAARSPAGQVMPGVFNTNHAQATHPSGGWPGSTPTSPVRPRRTPPQTPRLNSGRPPGSSMTPAVRSRRPPGEYALPEYATHQSPSESHWRTLWQH